MIITPLIQSLIDAGKALNPNFNTARFLANIEEGLRLRESSNPKPPAD